MCSINNFSNTDDMGQAISLVVLRVASLKIMQQHFESKTKYDLHNFVAHLSSSSSNNWRCIYF